MPRDAQDEIRASDYGLWKFRPGPPQGIFTTENENIVLKVFVGVPIRCLLEGNWREFTVCSVKVSHVLCLRM